MERISRREAGARARAAIEYAGLTTQQVADRTGLSYNAVKSIRNGQRATDLLEMLLAIGKACGVPRAFMERGWDAIPDEHER